MSRRQSKPKTEKTFSLRAPSRPDRTLKENQLRSQLNSLAQSNSWKEILQICTQLGSERTSRSWLANIFFSALDATNQKQALLIECQTTSNSRPRDPTVLSWLAHALRLNGRVEESAEVLRKAIKHAKPDAALFNSLGSALKETGEFEEARSWFSRTIALQPKLAKAHWNRSDLLSDHQQAVDTIEVIIGSENQALPEDHLLYFSLYRHYEKLGDYDSAFSKLQIGNRLKRQQISYSSENSCELTDKILAAFQNTDPEPHTSSNKTHPIFIFGLPRSGTTLVEQILASHPEVHGGNELTFLNDAGAMVQQSLRLAGGFPEWISSLPDSGWKQIGDNYSGLIETLDPGDKRVTDKSLMNFRAAGLIARALPGAKMVHLVRDPMDVAFGCYRQVFGSGHLFSYQFDEIADMLMDHKKLLNHWQNSLGSSQYFALDYQELVQNPSEKITELLNFCELSDEPACYTPEQTKRTVRTLSATQVRLPINTAGLGGWKRYEEQLLPLKGALQNRGLIS